MVGRDAELRLLKDLFHATSRERRVRLVSITGQGGIGKSRLAWEFLKYVDGVVERVWWHEGRSPSYGEGITFWALGEMVRSRARLLESDDPATTRTRIAEMLAEHVPDEAERRRIEPALLALLGVGETPAGGAAGAVQRLADVLRAAREHRRRGAAVRGPPLGGPGHARLHRAHARVEPQRPDPDHHARPPRAPRQAPGLGRRASAAFLALDLQPLDEASMRQLLGGLVVGPARARRPLDRRAGRGHSALRGRDHPDARRGRAPGRTRGRRLSSPSASSASSRSRTPCTRSSPPGSTASIPPIGRSSRTPRSSASRSASTGWPRSSGSTSPRTAAHLERLVRLDLLRQEVDPRSPERGQYAFVQALIREVAYATLSLRDRRARHLAAARHFESLGDEELAGALAAHYVAAYRASAEGPEAEALGEPGPRLPACRGRPGLRARRAGPGA